MTLAPSLVVDTGVASLPFKENQPTKLEAYGSLLEGHTLILPFMSLAELWQWAEVGGWGAARRSRMRTYLERFIVAHSSPVLSETWAYLMGISKRGGHNLGHADARIAATALTRDIPLVSDNVRHFEWIPGLRLLTVS